MIIASISLIPLNFFLIKSVKERNEKIKTPTIIKSTKLQLKSLIYILDKNGIVSKISVYIILFTAEIYSKNLINHL